MEVRRALRSGLRRSAGLGTGTEIGAAAVLASLLLAMPLLNQSLWAQTCTTQAAMTPEVRNALANKALELATAVEGGDTVKLQRDTIPEFAANFGPTADLVHSTAAQLGGDLLRVMHLYELNASGRKPDDASVADFSCPLIGTTSETDFAIPGLPPGTYAFAMVNANGPEPWLLAFLLQQGGGQWKMAGFYPRARSAAGHDGLWYWRAARNYVKSQNGPAKQKDLWLAWLMYGEAEQLLRPANFVTSTNLEMLETERRTAVPPELMDGIGPQKPLVVKSAGGAATSPKGLDSRAPNSKALNSGATDAGAGEFRFTRISTEGSADGRGLNLMLHLELAPGTDPAAPDPAAARARNKQAAAALLDAHKQLRQAFENVWIFAESPGHDTFATEEKVADVP